MGKDVSKRPPAYIACAPSPGARSTTICDRCVHSGTQIAVQDLCVRSRFM
ncbi:unnamed protein product [Staurois parvus]|uniref:Uncharacterized protein n=1 Tax=Staurois parvus TaxID=386267 RepID=A0ABN9BXN9_9NEOB|nr:unnamed protein product [Staurois parvus]